LISVTSYVFAESDEMIYEGKETLCAVKGLEPGLDYHFRAKTLGRELKAEEKVHRSAFTCL
jgi:hypothetical protein